MKHPTGERNILFSVSFPADVQTESASQSVSQFQAVTCASSPSMHACLNKLLDTNVCVRERVAEESGGRGQGETLRQTVIVTRELGVTRLIVRETEVVIAKIFLPMFGKLV